jgi:hypothetical protein
MPDAFVRDPSALAAALTEDNRRREQAGRQPLFAVEGEAVALAAQPEPGERAAAVAVARPVAPADVRRGALAALRRRLRECDGPTVEWIAARLLERMGVKELKVAKRGRDHVVFTGRRRMGLGEVRHCMRVLRAGAEPVRRDVADLRRDIGSYGAQIGVLLSAGDVGREARAEAAAAGQLPVVLLCGEAIAEALSEAGVGCRPVVVPEIDEEFFRSAADAAAEEEAARRARREERDRREEQERRERRERRDERSERPERPAAEVVAAEGGGEATATAAPDVGAGEEPAVAAPEQGAAAGAAAPEAPASPAAPGADEDEEPAEDEEAGEGQAAAEGQPAGREPGRRRRRRRRRRGRGGGGERREGSPGAGAPAGEGGVPGGEGSPTGGSEGGGPEA